MHRGGEDMKVVQGEGKGRKHRVISSLAARSPEPYGYHEIEI